MADTDTVAVLKRLMRTAYANSAWWDAILAVAPNLMRVEHPDDPLQFVIIERPIHVLSDESAEEDQAE